MQQIVFFAKVAQRKTKTSTSCFLFFTITKTNIEMNRLIFVITCFLLILFNSNQSFSQDKQECSALIEFCPTCDYSQMIDYIEKWSNPTSLKHYLKKIEPIKKDVEQILIDNNVSRYYLYLALAESGGIVDNESPKKAKGLWQLMPFISRHYGLIVNKEKDERLDYKKSTEAAAKYIMRNLEAFDNNALWAIAAYNAGGSNLKKLTNYKNGDSLKKVISKSYPSYALALTVLKMIYVAECETI